MAEMHPILWSRLAESPFAPYTEPLSAGDYEKICPGDGARIIRAAEKAVERRVDLLGSGEVALGRPIQWHKDFKSGHSWPMALFRRLDILDLDRDSDVKVPWELSRLQWLIPAGQAYLLTGDEAYLDPWRKQIDKINAQKKYVKGRPMYPHMYGLQGWYHYTPEKYSQNALEIYYHSMKPSDLPRVPANDWRA